VDSVVRKPENISLQQTLKYQFLDPNVIVYALVNVTIVLESNIIGRISDYALDSP
jgi:hypothetical protein